MIKIKKFIRKKYSNLKCKYYNPIILKDKPKIFCIGKNKTGTTSLKKAFLDLGYIVGDQRQAELLQPYYLRGNFKPIIEYCKSAQVFQDYPFSFPETYKYIDKAYPGSKFILTVRDSAEQWYNSLVKFHAKLFGNGSIPTSEQLRRVAYCYPGWIWNNYRYLHSDKIEKEPYNKEVNINSYLKYNEEVINYFKARDEDFIIINVGKKGDYERLMKFLNIESNYDNFPWKNKTLDIKIDKIIHRKR